MQHGEDRKVTKYSRYQDYVIKEGRLIGEFEDMYRDFDDPWEQTTRESYASEKAVAINILRRLREEKGVERVLEIGCGLGAFTKRIFDIGGILVKGIDISETAVRKAKVNYPHIDFHCCHILDKDVFRDFEPDVIVMAEVTWYVLDHLDEWLDFYRLEMPHTYLIHLLNTYPPGEQGYGKEKFTTLNEIMEYFGMTYLEYGEITDVERNGCRRTYFLGNWSLPGK